jgi:hypothetical protein
LGARCGKIGGENQEEQQVKNRAATKTELMKKAEMVIDELLDWHQEADRPNLN